MDDLAAWHAGLPSTWVDGTEPVVYSTARKAHDTPGRHYHTWSHVLDCVDKLGAFACPNPRLVFHALVFHDAVYVAGATDNEERSADLAVKVLESHSSMVVMEREEIRRMILATRSHVVASGEPSDDLRAVVDIDMSILGSPPEAYRRYSQDVEREWCPSVTSVRRFRLGRLRFLRGVLRLPRIYSTPEGVVRWEESARRNIIEEIRSIESRLGFMERLVDRFLPGV